MKILENEILKLKKKLREAQGNLNDTGQDRYYNLVFKYEKAILEIEQLIKANENVTLMKREHDDLLQEILAKAEDLRREYPHDDGLLLFLNWLNNKGV